MVFKLLGLPILIFVHGVLGYHTQDAPLLKKRPHWLKICKQSDPGINKCVDDMFLEMFPYLAVGIPEINVEHFEPMFLERVSISQGNGAIDVSGSFENLTIVGPSKSIPRDTDFFKDGNMGYWNFRIDIPLLDIKSIYDLKGHILVLPLHGHGNSKLKLYDIQTNIFTDLSFPSKEGREVLNIDTMKVEFKVGSMKIQLDNLFNGNEVLGQTVNAFINQNGLEIISELEDSLGSSLAKIFKKILNNIFTKIPLDLWYLSDAQYEQYEKDVKETKIS